MKILVIGSGGREHAIGWKLAQSEERHELFFAPGNPGMGELGQRLEIKVTDIEGLALFAEREGIDLTVVGPEVPLSMGLADRFREKGLRVFGPDRAGAQIEASKVYAKEMLEKAGVPTAGYAYCEDLPSARKALAVFVAPYVIKEDGLAAGKGVTIAPDREAAEKALEAAFSKDMPVVIEEFLQGEELSVLAICDGQRAIPMISAQDFKKAGEGNIGPNTGGMGAYAPVPFVDKALTQRVQAEVLDPMMAAFRAEGIDYRGVLYAGLMIAPDGTPKVIEFNCRFGDPETQVVLPLLEDDLAAILMRAADGDLGGYPEGFRFKTGESAVTVVLASEGYPGEYDADQPIRFPDALPENTVLFHAGTRLTPTGEILTNGGRVLNATGLGAGLQAARQNAYRLADAVVFANKVCRRDIAEAATGELARI